MALSLKARRGWALVILVVGMPLWIVLAVTLVGLLNRPPVLVELAIYLGLGLAWALPFKFIFRGVGQPAPAPAPAPAQGNKAEQSEDHPA